MMKILYKKLLILFFLAAPMLSWGQNEQEVAVEKAVRTLFKGMYDGDSALVHTVFEDDVRMFTSFVNADGKAVLRPGSLDIFLKAVGAPHDQVWDEQIRNLSVQVDDNLAHAWMEYSFFAGDNFSHCGVNAMQLTKDDGQWKIIHLIDTRRKDPCVKEKE